MVRHTYDRLSALFTKAHSGKKIMEVQEMLNKEWKIVKRDQALFEDLVNKPKRTIKTQEERANTM